MANLSLQSGRRVLVIIFLLLLAACAPDDLDITPTATITPAPSPTPTATPAPEDFVDTSLANDVALSVILDAIPDRVASGAVEWRRDFTRGTDGVEALPNVQNGVSSRVYYNEQQGGQMNLSFGVFDTPDDAIARYEFIRGLRQPLITGTQKAEFPQPNIFGAGLYGSVAIFQIDNYFIEVNIELFSSTQGNPLDPLSRATINFFESIRADADAALTATTSSTAEDSETAEPEVIVESITGEPLLDAVLAYLPAEILGDAVWNRDMSRGTNGIDIPPQGFTNGTAVQVYYNTQSSGNMRITFGHFNSSDDALVQYDRFKGFREGLEAENSREGFPIPHSFGAGLYGSVAIFHLDDVFLEVLIERAPGTIANPLESISRRMLMVLDEARASLE